MLAALFLLCLLFPTASAARILLTGSTIKYSGNHMELLEIGGNSPDEAMKSITA